MATLLPSLAPSRRQSNRTSNPRSLPSLGQRQAAGSLGPSGTPGPSKNLTAVASCPALFSSGDFRAAGGVQDRLLPGYQTLSRWSTGTGPAATLLRANTEKLPFLNPKDAHKVLGEDDGTQDIDRVLVNLGPNHSVLGSFRNRQQKPRKKVAHRHVEALPDRFLLQEAALAGDRRYVQSLLEEQVQKHMKELASDSLLVEHRWAQYFLPLVRPQALLPKVFDAQPGLLEPSLSQAGLSVTGHRAQKPLPLEPDEQEEEPLDSKALAEEEKALTIMKAKLQFKTNRSIGMPDSIGMGLDEVEAFARVARLFCALVLPCESDDERVGATGPAVLTRGSFCHMVYALNALIPPQAGRKQQAVHRRRTSVLAVAKEDYLMDVHSRPQLVWAAQAFDSAAVPCPVRGTSCPGGVLIGIPLTVTARSMPGDDYEELRRLIDQLLAHMGKDPSYGAGISRKMRKMLAGQDLFDILLPRAETYARERLARLGFPTPFPPKKDSEEAGEGDSEDSETPRSTGGTSDVKSPALGPRTMPMETLSEKSVAPLSDRSESPWHKQSNQSKVSRSRESTPKGSARNPPQAPVAAPAPPPEDKCLKSAETAAAYKAEYLQTCLMEPEVVQLVAMFAPDFRRLFSFYCDVPTNDDRGHMTMTGFVRFCLDFGILPDWVDFQTVHWLYKSTAEAAPRCELKETLLHLDLLASPKGVHKGSKEARSLKRGASNVSKDSAHRGAQDRGTNSKETGKGNNSKGVIPESRRLSQGSSAEPPAEPSHSFWCGYQLPNEISWVVQDLGKLTAAQTAGLAALTAMSEWMTDRCVTVIEVFAFLDVNKNGLICRREMEKGLAFMGLVTENTSSDTKDNGTELADVLFPLLSNPDSGGINLLTLQQALVVVGKMKAKTEVAQNCFMQSEMDMTPAAHDASIFFQALLQVMEARRWTPARLFQSFDKDGDGELTMAEITARAKWLLATSKISCYVAAPFELLDLNGDGVVQLDEFVETIRLVRRAREVMGTDVPRGGRSLLTAAAATSAAAQVTTPAPEVAPPAPISPTASEKQTKRGQPMPSVELSAEQLQADAKARLKAAMKASADIAAQPFRLASFVEALLQVGIEVITFRSSPDQSQLPTVIKVLWLMLFLRQQFSDMQQREGERAQRLEELRRTELLEAEQDYIEAIMRARQQGDDPPAKPEVSQVPKAQYVPPRRKLLQSCRDIFADAYPNPGSLPMPWKEVTEQGAQSDPATPCERCGNHRNQGWGCLSCVLCSEGDAAALACMKATTGTSPPRPLRHFLLAGDVH